MQINRHNYEEFFILYMDNELCDADRRMVESFVQKHPDLKDELDTLLQYKLEPDTSVNFIGKDDLLKLNGESPITLTNYEEWLLLCADGELNVAQETAVKNFIAAHPAINKEWEQLLQSRFQPDEAIIFADKDKLYRREEKVRPMLPRWWRMAAAAVLLIGAGLTTAIIINNNKKDITPSGTIADGSTNNNNNGSNTGIPVQANPLPGQNSTNNTSPVQTASTGIAAGNTSPATDNKRPKDGPAVALNNNKARKNVFPDNGIQPAEKNNPAIVTPAIQKKQENTGIAANTPSVPSNNLPSPENNPNYTTSNKSNDAVAKTNIPDEVKNSANSLTTKDVTTEPAQPSDFVQASLREDGKKNKLRGLFRKITRTFEKRTNTEPENGNDRLLIAGLSIKMK